MATLSTIVNDAFRESGIVPVGGTPDTNESTEALNHLLNYISSLYGNEAGTNLMPYDVGNNGITYQSLRYDQWTDRVISNSLLVCNMSSPQTLYLPTIPNDGDMVGALDNSGTWATAPLTLNGDGRQIEGAQQVVLNTNGDNRTWFFRGDIAQWVKLSPLSGSSNSPFPSMYDEMLMIWLAMRLNPRYGGETAQETVAEYKRLLRSFEARYKPQQEMQSEDALIRLPSFRPFYSIAYFNDFNRGR